MARARITMIPAITAAGYPDGTNVAVERTTTGGDAALVVPATPNATGGFDLLDLATQGKLEEVRVLLAAINANTDGLETLAGVQATEAKLEQVRVLLASINTTAALQATDAKLEQVRLQLVAINANTDTLETLAAGQATDAKLEAVRLQLAAINANTDTLETLAAGQATDSKLEAVRLLLASINTTAGLQATEAKLEAVRVLINTVSSSLTTLNTTASAQATEAKLETVRVLLASINTTAGLQATEAKLEAVRVLINSVNTNLTTLNTTAGLQATEAKLEAVRVLLSTVSTSLNTLNTTASAQATDARLELVRVLLAGTLSTRGKNATALTISQTLAVLGQVTLGLADTVDNAENATVVIRVKTTVVVVGTLVFEANYGTSAAPSWFPVVVQRIDTAGTLIPVTGIVNPAVSEQVFHAFVPGATQFRARYSAYASGSIDFIIRAIPGVAIQQIQAYIQNALTIAGTVTVQGGAAQNTAPTGNLLQVGFEGRLTNRAKTTDGNITRPITDLAGRTIIAPVQARELLSKKFVSLTAVTETVLAAAVAGVFQDITFLLVTYSGTNANTLSFRDTTAGAVVMSLALPTTGGNWVIALSTPLLQAAVNTNWTVALTSAVTGGTCTVTAIVAQML